MIMAHNKSHHAAMLMLPIGLCIFVHFIYVMNIEKLDRGTFHCLLNFYGCSIKMILSVYNTLPFCTLTTTQQWQNVLRKMTLKKAMGTMADFSLA